VQAAFAAHLILEMLDRIGHEDFIAGNTCFRLRLVEHASSRPYEGLAGEVFLVARLLADEHDVGVSVPFPRRRLRGIPIERATPACLLCLRELPQRPNHCGSLEIERHLFVHWARFGHSCN
jgi:hypothetical protein